MPWLAYHNSEIDWKTREVKIMRCPEECGKQWRLKQGKLGWQKQKKRREETRRRKEERRERENEERKEEEKEKQDNRCKESSGRMGNLG